MSPAMAAGGHKSAWELAGLVAAWEESEKEAEKSHKAKGFLSLLSYYKNRRLGIEVTKVPLTVLKPCSNLLRLTL